MGNSSSKRNKNKFNKHSRSKSEMKIKNPKHKHKYRPRSRQHNSNNTEKIKFDINDSANINVSKNVRRIASLNDIHNMHMNHINNEPIVNKPIVNKQPQPVINNINASIPKLYTPQISSSINNSNSDSAPSSIHSIDNSNIATLTTNDITFKYHNNHNIQESDSSIPNYGRGRAFSTPKQYSHRLQNSSNSSTTTYTSLKKENKRPKTPTLPDPTEIEDFGLDDDEACKSYLSPSIEAEPIPKSIKSLESIHSIPLSAISKMSVTDEFENELSESSSESLLQRDNNPNRQPINFRNYYSEHDKPIAIKRRKSFNHKGNGLIKVRSTPNLKGMAMHNNNNNKIDNHNNNNNNNLLLVINDNKTHFVDSDESQDEEIKKEENNILVAPILGQSLSLNINDISPSSISISSTGAVTSSPLMAVVTDKVHHVIHDTSPRLRLLRSKSDVLNINHMHDYERRYKNNQQRKYRSKYSGHYKISLATSKTSDVTGVERTHSRTHIRTHDHDAMRRGRSNSDSMNNDNDNDGMKHKQRKAKKKEKNKKRKRKKIKSKAEKYKGLKKPGSGGIINHFRSRSHSLANIHKTNKNRKRRKKKKKERAKHAFISYKGINNGNENDSNGIIDIYITKTFAISAYKFWNENICTLNEREFRECATLFFSHLMADSETDSKILMRNNNIIEAPLKYFDMIGFLFRLLIDENINGYLTLKEIGKIHLLQYNISISSYYAMLNALHIIFTELCPQKHYTMKLRYIYDIVFLSACFIMNGNKMDVNHNQCLIKQKFDTLNSLYFLQSLDICLFDEIGCEYLYHFLYQSYCEEIPKFLVLYNKFKHCNPHNHRLKYKISNTIYDQCIADSAQFQINVPFATYQQIKVSINNIHNQHVENDIFDVAYQQIKRLIQQNHWANFKNILQSIRKQGQIGN